MEQGDFRPMAQNREAMADLVAILEARRADYARAEAVLDTSGEPVERVSKLICLIAPYIRASRRATADGKPVWRGKGMKARHDRLADAGFIDRRRCGSNTA